MVEYNKVSIKLSDSQLNQLKSDFQEYCQVLQDFSLLENMSSEKRILRASYGNKEGKEMLRAGCGYLIKKHFDSTPSLTDFKIQKYYQNVLYSRDNLPKKTKYGTNVINLHEYTDAGTYQIPLYAQDIKITYFDSFGVEHVPKEI